MSQILKPIFWRNQAYKSGDFPQPVGMSERAYLMLWRNGNLAKPVPSDMIETYSFEELEAVLSLAEGWPTGCAHCRTP